MAGYSGTPLAKKLGIKEGHRVVLVGAPEGTADLLDPLPADVECKASLRGRAAFDVALLFAPSARVLRNRFATVAERLTDAGGLWVCWPKKASGVVTDVDEGLVRGHGLECGLVDNKICAIDETWSGLRFVYRLADRPARAEQRG